LVYIFKKSRFFTYFAVYIRFDSQQLMPILTALVRAFIRQSVEYKSRSMDATYYLSSTGVLT